MATKPNEPNNPEKGIQPSQGGRGLDQGGPKTDAEKKTHESGQAAQHEKDVAGSNARRDANTKAYLLGEVGPKGQAFKAKIYKSGDKIWLMPAEAKSHQEHGVPLTLVDEDDKPQDVV